MVFSVRLSRVGSSVEAMEYANLENPPLLRRDTFGPDILCVDAGSVPIVVPKSALARSSSTPLHPGVTVSPPGTAISMFKPLSSQQLTHAHIYSCVMVKPLTAGSDYIRFSHFVIRTLHVGFQTC